MLLIQLRFEGRPFVRGSNAEQLLAGILELVASARMG